MDRCETELTVVPDEEPNVRIIEDLTDEQAKELRALADAQAPVLTWEQMLADRAAVAV